MPKAAPTIAKALFSFQAVGMMCTAAALILALVLASPMPGFKTKLTCFFIAIIAVISIALYVRSVFQQARIREQLSEYLSEGTRLLDQCKHNSNRNIPPPEAETDLWIDAIEKYVMDKLERSDYLRFHGTPTSSTTPFVGHAMTEPYWAQYRRIFARLEVLKELIREQGRN